MNTCDKCGLRCTVHFPGKKVPYSESNCPREITRKKKVDIRKAMPELARFNDICIDHGIEPVKWE